MLRTRLTEDYGLDVPFIAAGMAFVAMPHWWLRSPMLEGWGRWEHRSSRRTPCVASSRRSGQ